MQYRERLHAPGWYWLVGVLFGGSTIVAVGFWFGPWVAVGGGLAVVAAITIALAWWGRTEIVVDGAGVAVGGALLEWPWIGDVAALDPEQTRRMLGVDADARAFTVERPWLDTAVRINVADSEDPHPYWLVSTSSPARLARAITEARSGAQR